MKRKNATKHTEESKKNDVPLSERPNAMRSRCLKAIPDIISSINLDYTTRYQNFIDPKSTIDSKQYNFYSCSQKGEAFKNLVLSIFQPGEIIIKNSPNAPDNQDTTLKFESSNYIETTYYERAERNVSNTVENILVAGDLITFEIELKNENNSDVKHNLDMAIFITEVATKLNGEYVVESSIKTGVKDRPSPTTIDLADPIILSTMKDTLGNSYVIKSKVDLTKIGVFLEKKDNNYVTIVPTNMSKCSGSINYNPNFSDINDIFDRNQLHYVDSLRNPRMVILPTATEVDLPNSFPEQSADTTIKPFDCHVKGLIMFNRIGSTSESTDYILQNMNFDMFDYNEIKVFEENGALKISLPWLDASLPTSGNDGSKLYFKNPEGSPFPKGVGAFDPLVTGTEGEDKKLNFNLNIYSPNFFIKGNDANVLTKEINNPNRKVLKRRDDSEIFLTRTLSNDNIYVPAKNEQSSNKDQNCSIV